MIKKTIAVFFLTAFFFSCHNANSLAKQGLKNLEQGKKITALKFFEQALDANKKNPIALYGKGKIMMESNLTISLGQRMVESALPNLDKKYKTDAILSLGRSYAATNVYDQAIKVLAGSIETGNHAPEIYIDLSFYYLQILEKNQARNILVKGLSANPKSTALLSAMANLDIKYFHNYYAAIKSLENAIQIDKTDITNVRKIAELFYKTGRTDKSVEYLKILKDMQTDNNEKLNTEKIILQAQTGQWQIAN